MTTEGPNTWDQSGSTGPGVPPPPAAQAPPGPPPTQGAPLAYGTPPGGAGGRQLGKIRNPWGVWGLSIITFGIYYLYWWYKINEEVKQFDQSIDVDPTWAMLANFVPIANIVTLVKTGGRIGQAERSAGNPSPCSGGLGFLLALVFSLHIIYYQGHLNRLWEQHGGRPQP